MPIKTIKIGLIFGLLVIAFLCYLPGLAGSFIFDDLVNIRMNSNLAITSLDYSSIWHAANSGTAGLFKRPISTSSFAINHYFSGFEAYYYKLTNLMIHLLNGLLVYLFVSSLLKLHERSGNLGGKHDSDWVALGVSAIWLLHPFNLTGVLYVVQRMTSLSALFTLVGLNLYVYGRSKLLNRKSSGLTAICFAIFLATPLAVLSKENGILLPLLIFLVEITLLKWKVGTQASRKWLYIIVGMSAGAPMLAGSIFMLNNMEILLTGYSWRDFSLIERLMTECRVLWFYIQMTLLPNMAAMGLHHDDFLISRNLLSPWTTIASLLALLLLTTMAFASRNKFPVLSFGILFFLVGHSLESTFLPLEIAFEHRNYLPMLGILLPLVYYAFNAKAYLPGMKLRSMIISVLIIIFASLTALRADQWGDPLLMRMLEVERHPDSVRANTDLAVLYSYIPPSSQENAIELYNKAVFHFQRAADIAPSNIAGLVGILALQAERGLPADDVLITELERRLQIVPFGPPNKNTLVGVVRCIGTGSCDLNPEIINRLHRAALSNPRLTGAHRDEVIFEFNQLPLQIWPRAVQ